MIVVGKIRRATSAEKQCAVASTRRFAALTFRFHVDASLVDPRRVSALGPMRVFIFEPPDEHARHVARKRGNRATLVAMTRRHASFVFSVLALATACSGDDASSTPPVDGSADARTDSIAPLIDASATADAADTSSVGATDASVSTDGDASVTPTDGDAGASDTNRADVVANAGDSGDAASEASAESGADGADAPQAVSDAPLDVDVSGGTILLLGGGPDSIFTGEFHPPGPWLISTLTGSTSDRPAVALTGASSGIGVIRSKIGDEMLFTSWSPGRFGVLAAIGSGATTSGPPALAASASRVDLAYHGVDLKHYFASYVGTWTPTAEPIGAGSLQSSGPTPASITLLGADTIVAYADDDRLLSDRSRLSGAWQTVHTGDLGDAGAGVAVTPTIVAPTSGPELLIAFVRSPDQDVFYTTRSAGTWADPQAVPGAFAADSIALLPIAGGDVILVLRSIDSHGYWARYSAGAWSDLKAFPWFDLAVPSTPSLAPGIGGADAEIAFVNVATGEALHAQLHGSSWGNLVTVGGSGLTSVSIASAP